MVETITPAVHGGRNHRYFSTAVLHVLGASLTAAALGVMLGSIGRALGAPWGTAGAAAVAGVAAVYMTREGLGAPIPLPDLRRQVPRWWRSFFSPEVAALLYGAGLGVGFATFLSHGTLVAVAAGAIATGDPVVGAAIVLPFGTTRAVAVIAAGRLDDAQIERIGSSLVPRAINALVLAVVLTATLARVF